MNSPILTVEAKRHNATISVRYKIENPSSGPIVILDQLWTVEGSAIVPDPAQAYVSVGKDGILRLGRFLHPLPEYKLVEQTIVPFGRQLDPKAQLTGQIEITEPVHEYSPYYDDPKKQDEREVRCTALKLRVSWMVRDEQTQLLPASLPGAFRVDHSDLSSVVKNLECPPIPLHILARRRTDQFERFE